MSRETTLRYVRESPARDPKWGRKGCEGAEHAQYYPDGQRRDARPFVGVSYLAHGDYLGSSVERSNVRAWIEDVAAHAGVWCEVHGSHGYQAIEVRASIAALASDPVRERRYLALVEALCADETYTAVYQTIEALQALEEYPLLDEDHHNKMESDESWEAWGDYGADYLRKQVNALIEPLGFDALSSRDQRENQEVKRALWEFYNAHNGDASPYCEGGTSYVFPGALIELPDAIRIAYLAEQPEGPRLPWELRAKDHPPGLIEVWSDLAIEQGIKDTRSTQTTTQTKGEVT